jgi:hypothetical protein
MERPVGESDTFATCSEYGLYLKALDWCVRNAGRNLPSEWVIPDSVIAGWNERRTANRLAANGIWEHDDYEHVYRFRYISKQNTPARLRDSRKKQREKKARQRRSDTDVADVPPGTNPMSPRITPGDNDLPGVSRKEGHVQKKTL